MISGKFVSGITNKDFYPSALKYLTYCLPGCTNPCFLVAKKKNQSCEILVPKIQQVMFLILSSYFVNILPNYLIFSNLAHFSISRYLFLVIWYSDSKTTEYSVLLVSLTNQVCFRICNSEVLFFVLACYCLQLITQKQ